jgi:hypothetical protein
MREQYVLLACYLNFLTNQCWPVKDYRPITYLNLPYCNFRYLYWYCFTIWWNGPFDSLERRPYFLSHFKGHHHNISKTCFSPLNNLQYDLAWFKVTLKVPKCEIFHRSDFNDFTPWSLYGRATLGLKLKKLKNIFRGSFGAAKFLTRMLSLILRSAVPSKHAEHTHQGLMRTGQELMR